MPKAPNPPLPRGAYDEALRRARRAAAGLDVALVRDIRLAVRRWADALAREVRRLAGGGLADAERARTASRLIALRTSRRLERAIRQAIAGSRRVSFERVLAIYQQAQDEAIQAVGVPLRALGAIRIAPLDVMGIYEAAGAASTWRTLVAGHVRNAAAEAQRIVRLGLVEGIGFEELGRRLRRYVVGSEPFDALFTDVPTITGSVAKIDLRRLPLEMRGAARQMVHNALRIGVTELHNARAEAEVQHGIQGPFIRAIRWRLAVDRGTQVTPDECDILAAGDFYGLGKGIYPVRKVPRPPHPWDRCEREQIMARSLKELRSPKPDPARSRSAGAVAIPRASLLTANGAARARAQAEVALRFGDTALAA